MRKLIVIIVGTLVLTGCAVSTGTDETPTSNTTVTQQESPTVDQGVGSKDATADVVIGKTLKSDGYGLWPWVSVTVTNHSEKTSDYYITVSLNSADGKEQLDTGVVFVDRLKPGQTKKDRAAFIQVDGDHIPKKAVVTLEEVQRTAS